MHVLTVDANATKIAAMQMTPTGYGEAVAAEVRAELARQRKTQNDLAASLGITAATAARRLDGSVPFDTRELFALALWLNVPVSAFMPPPNEAAS